MKSSWTTCGGTAEEFRISRRGLFQGAALLGLALTTQTSWGQMTINRKRSSNHVLVSIFLRGGADGLNMVVPYTDDAYYKARPSVAVPAKSCLDLDGRLGLHPSLAKLKPLFDSKELAILTGVGSFDTTRSHFEAMSTMERGEKDGRSSSHTGWLARYLLASRTEQDSPLRAVAMSNLVPDSLIGWTNSVAMTSLEELKLRPGEIGTEDEIRKLLRDVYAEGSDLFADSGRQTLTVLETLQNKPLGEVGQAGYPDTELGNGLRQVAHLIKNEVGLEVACVDKGGWDTHAGQGSTGGWMPSLMEDLAACVAAFYKDIGDKKTTVTLVVQSEFGRRVDENAALGTDHGLASVMFVLGEGISGGKLYGEAPDLVRKTQDQPWDVPVSLDYRVPLREVLESRMGFVDSSAEVFPGLAAKTIGLA